MQVVGIHKEASQRRVVGLRRDRKGIAIDFLHTFHEEQNLKEELKLKKILEKEWSFVAGIEGKDLFIRKMKTPLKKRRAILKTLPFQLKSLIPYSMEEGVVKPLFQRKGEMTELTLFALSKKFLRVFLEKLEKELLDPEWLSSTPMALFRMGEWLAPNYPSLLVIHIGVERTELVLIQQQMIDSHLSLSLGTQDFFSACLEDNPYLTEEKGIHQIRQLDLNKLKQEEFPHLFALAEQFKQRIDRALCFFTKRSKELSLPPLLFLGDGNLSFTLESLIVSGAEEKLTLLEVEGCRGFDLQTIKPYAIPLGLSLDILKQDEKTIEWRERAFISPGRIKKILHGILRGAFLSTLFFVFVFLVSHYLIKHKESRIEKKIETLIETYKEELPSLSQAIAAKKVQGKIELLKEKALHSKSHFYSFAPVPKVADLLSYLSDHPKLNREEGGITIEEVCYTIEDLSSFQKGAALPKIRVDLKLQAKEGQFVREFHDALVEGDVFIDHEKEIGWKRNESEYEISFYLKS
ncbi:MAG: hypothetical protein HYZ47_00785 [Simkania negevensis]|nr:hypothetical protein [Simkania negevensis]